MTIHLKEIKCNFKKFNKYINTNNFNGIRLIQRITDMLHLLHFTLLCCADAALLTNQRFVATLCWASLIGTIFLTVCTWFLSLCHVLVSQYFKLFHYYYIHYGDPWSVIFDVNIAKIMAWWRLKWWLALFSSKCFLIKMCTSLKI